MPEPYTYDEYPVSIVIAFWVVMLLQSIIGLYLMYMVHPALSGLFLVYLVVLELKVYREGCVSCCYYGKRCMSGRGKIAAFLFKRQDPKRFCEKPVTWKNLLSNILVVAIPVLAGIYVMIQAFSFVILGLTIILLLIWFIANPIIYGRLACPHCKQGRICCPANDFFGKKS